MVSVRFKEEIKMKKILSLILAAFMFCTLLVSCGNNSSTDINVYSREKGSGTRGAFIELFGIEQKNSAGEKVDYTWEKASTSNSTAVMIQQVVGDKNGIGYISLGSLSKDVKAVKIDGAEATVENVKNGTYKISRPFNIVTKDTVSEVAEDFIDFILSSNGQAVVAKKGYITLSGTESYVSKNLTGKIKVSGSSSVSPLMDALKDEYKKLNPNVTIELQTSDSGTGVSDAVSGTSDIGMASRALKDSETAKGVHGTVIATDGIAVIVNNENSVDALTSEQVKKIFMGELRSWTEIGD